MFSSRRTYNSMTDPNIISVILRHWESLVLSVKAFIHYPDRGTEGKMSKEMHFLCVGNWNGSIWFAAYKEVKTHRLLCKIVAAQDAFWVHPSTKSMKSQKFPMHFNNWKLWVSSHWSFCHAQQCLGLIYSRACWDHSMHSDVVLLTGSVHGNEQWIELSGWSHSKRRRCEVKKQKNKN